MKTNTIVVVASALLAGFAAGWMMKPHVSADKIPSESPASARKGRIQESRTRVKTVTSIVTNTVVNTVTNTVEVRERRGRGGMGGFLANLEKMKDDDPERYASMTNRMAQFRERMLQSTENRIETLSSINTAGWSKRQIDTHEKYQELLAKREELMELMNPLNGASAEDRESAMQEFFKLGRELHDIGEQERNTLLEKTFSGLGYNEPDAAEIIDAVKTIYSTTQDWPGPRGGRRMGGPPPPTGAK